MRLSVMAHATSTKCAIMDTTMRTVTAPENGPLEPLAARSGHPECPAARGHSGAGTSRGRELAPSTCRPRTRNKVRLVRSRQTLDSAPAEIAALRRVGWPHHAAGGDRGWSKFMPAARGQPQDAARRPGPSRVPSWRRKIRRPNQGKERHMHLPLPSSRAEAPRRSLGYLASYGHLGANLKLSEKRRACSLRSSA